MTTPIRPSLAQLLGTSQTPQARPAQVAEVAGRDPLSAQRDFFRQALNGGAPSSSPATAAPAPRTQTVASPTFTAADINRVIAPVTTPVSGNSETPLMRPGSYLNIRV